MRDQTDIDARIRNLQIEVQRTLADRPVIQADFGVLRAELAKSRRHRNKVAWATVGGVFAALAIVFGAATAWQASTFSALANQMDAVAEGAAALAKPR